MTVVDVAVVGAGPAGLAAAVAAAESGSSVVVVDAGPQPGGQYWRHPAEPAGPPAEHDDGTVDAGARRPAGHDRRRYLDLRARFDAARRSGRIDYLPATQVWFLESPGAADDRPFTLWLNGSPSDGTLGAGPTSRQRNARALILCPGGYDRQLPVPGWDLPGVMAAGGVQALLKGANTAAGHRVVVAGTGPFLLPVAGALAQAGSRVLGVYEANAVTGWLSQLSGVRQAPGRVLDAAGYALALARHRVPYRTRTVVTAIHGAQQVEAVTVTRLDRHGAPDRRTSRQLQVDLVALGWGFTPSLELVLAAGAETRVDADGSLVATVDDGQRTTAAGVFAAGEVTGVGGAALAVAEGELAGLTAAADLGRPVAPTRPLRRSVVRARAFAAALHRTYPVPPRWSDWLTDDTVVCRCEEVTAGRIREVRDDLGATDPRTVKLFSRTGMGWCQGRVCGFAAAQLTGVGTPDALGAIAKRPLCAPVSLAELARAGVAADPVPDPGGGRDGS